MQLETSTLISSVMCIYHGKWAGLREDLNCATVVHRAVWSVIEAI